MVDLGNTLNTLVNQIGRNFQSFVVLSFAVTIVNIASTALQVFVNAVALIAIGSFVETAGLAVGSIAITTIQRSHDVVIVDLYEIISCFEMLASGLITDGQFVIAIGAHMNSFVSSVNRLFASYAIVLLIVGDAIANVVLAFAAPFLGLAQALVSAAASLVNLNSPHTLDTLLSAVQTVPNNFGNVANISLKTATSIFAGIVGGIATGNLAPVAGTAKLSSSKLLQASEFFIGLGQVATNAEISAVNTFISEIKSAISNAHNTFTENMS